MLVSPIACVPASQPDVTACVEKPMVRAELFFGRDIRGRKPLSDAEWSDFAAQVIARQFPDGFTAFDGEGRWRNPTTGETLREPTKIVIIAADPSPDLSRKLSVVIDAYRRHFDQMSVGLTTSSVCAAF
jgi:hypothetical protein